MAFLTGPEAAAVLRAWCAEHRTNPTRFLRLCQPEVSRATLMRWEQGSPPTAKTWAKIEDCMIHFEERSINEALHGRGAH